MAQEIQDERLVWRKNPLNTCHQLSDRRWGDRITIWGTVSVRTTLPRGTPESIRALVRERIDRCGHNGGFVLAPANVISFDTPVENVLAMYEAGREFGW